MELWFELYKYIYMYIHVLIYICITHTLHSTTAAEISQVDNFNQPKFHDFSYSQKFHVWDKEDFRIT